MLRLYLFEWLTQRGVWYPRWAPDLFMGFGYPVFNYYAPGSTTPAWPCGPCCARTSGTPTAPPASWRAAGGRGTFALVVAAWRRLALGCWPPRCALRAVRLSDHALQRGAVPEALGLGLLPWLPFGAWQTWRAETPAGQAPPGWRATALATAALLLTHTLVARRPGHHPGLDRGPALILPDRAPWAGWPWPSSWARLPRASLLAPRGGESGAVQLEIGREGAPGPPGLAARPGGQQREAAVGGEPPDPRGAADLHLFYPHQHQFVVTLKPGLAQAALALLAVLASCSRGSPASSAWPPRRPLAAGPSSAAAPRPQLLRPAASPAGVSLPGPGPGLLGLLFTFSEPPGAPRARPLPLAVAGALAGPLRLLRRHRRGGGLGAPVDAGRGRPPGGAPGWALAGAALGLVLLNGWGGARCPTTPTPSAPWTGG